MIKTNFDILYKNKPVNALFGITNVDPTDSNNSNEDDEKVEQPQNPVHLLSS